MRLSVLSVANVAAAMVALTIVFAALVGCALGSFAGVVASRGLSASLVGRSNCDGCGRTLAWYELVPFISFIALRGRCRTCGAGIGWAPFLWEAGGGVIAVAITLAVLYVQI